MASYDVPKTAEERMSEFTRICDEFKQEYSLFKDRQKKVSGHRARKALLCIAKLTRFVRKDIQNDIAGAKKEAPKSAEQTLSADVAAPVESV